jgi:hypothetical protein
VKELLLFTSEPEAARAEVERCGGQVRQVFTPRVFVAEVPDGAQLAASTEDLPRDLDDNSRTMAEAWRSRASKRVSSMEGIPWDTPGFEPPC